MPQTGKLNPIGPRLRALAEARGLSTRLLQSRCQVDQSDLSKIYRGETSPTIETLTRILAALGCTWADLDDPRTTSTTIPTRGTNR